MKVTIVGAGNIGTQFAVHCAEKGHTVTLVSSRPNEIEKTLKIVNENGEIIHSADIFRATNDDSIAFTDAELIFVTLPANLMNEIAKRIEPYAKKGLYICLVPGTGGGECAFSGSIEKGSTVFGIQRVPSVARLIEYGKTVRAVGYRDELYVGALPASKAEECTKIIEDIFEIKTVALPNYLNITLTPSNPILHTTRLHNIYLDYKPGVVYNKVPLFYEDWNIETSVQLLACDDEVQKLCLELHQFDLSYVKSLRLHYESSDATGLTNKIRSIKGFKGLTSPAKKVEGGFIPDLESRYFSADFPYGLAILIQIADFVGVDAPNMKDTFSWYNSIIEAKSIYNYRDYNIDSYEKFIEFYLR